MTNNILSAMRAVARIVCDACGLPESAALALSALIYDAERSANPALARLRATAHFVREYCSRTNPERRATLSFPAFLSDPIDDHHPMIVDAVRNLTFVTYHRAYLSHAPNAATTTYADVLAYVARTYAPAATVPSVPSVPASVPTDVDVPSADTPSRVVDAVSRARSRRAAKRA